MVLDVPVGHPNFADLTYCPVCSGGILSERLRELSGLSPEMLGWTLWDFFKLDGRSDALAVAEKFAAEPAGWVTFWGGYGTGKTYLLAAVVNACRKSGIAASYHVLPELLNQLRATYDDDSDVKFDALLDRLKTVTVLALDEMDKARGTAWVLETVFGILDYRYRHLRTLGTVLAQNEDPVQVEGSPLAYLYSRQHDGRFEVVQIQGGDVRPLMGE